MERIIYKSREGDDISGYEFILDNINWSFSNLKSFIQCPFEWKLKYIDCEIGIDNDYGEFGSLCHKVLEKYFKGELPCERLTDYYIECFNNIFIAKNDRTEKLYGIGLNYFANYRKPIEIDKVIGVEKEVKFDFFGKQFIGFIDLIYQDINGNLIILDHKTAEYPFNKNGTIKKSKIKEFDFYKKQLYIYCLGVKKLYGRMPQKIGWNFIRDNKIELLDFNEDDYKDSCNWAINTINEIYNTEVFSKNESFFYCNKLCKYRDICYLIDEDDEAF